MKNKPILILIGGGVILCLFIWIYFPTFSKYQKLREEQDRMVQELEDLQQKISALEKERTRLKSDKDYIEKIIREELGLVREGEVVYKLVEDSSEGSE